MTEPESPPSLPSALKPWLAALSFFLLWNGLLFYGFVRDGTWLILVIASIFVHRKIGTANFAMIAFSFALITACLIGFVSWYFHGSFYFRAHDQLTTVDSDGLRIYRKNQTLKIRQQHGDLVAFAMPDQKFDQAERAIVFQTDSMGFRNDRDYHGQRFVLVGDSFIAGNDNTQSATLHHQLRDKYGLDTYSMGHPGGLTDYVDNIEKFTKAHGNQFKALVFLFEANDFPERRGMDREDAVQAIKQFYRPILHFYKSFFHGTDLYRFTELTYHAMKKKIKTPVVEIHTLGSHRVAFWNTRKLLSKENYDGPPFFESDLQSVKDRIGALVFIPDKLRVYQSLIEPDAKRFPHAHWDYVKGVAKRLNVPALDLTPALEEASRLKLKESDQLTFWPDDTHWNPAGIGVSAATLCEQLVFLTCAQTTPAT